MDGDSDGQGSRPSDGLVQRPPRHDVHSAGAVAVGLLESICRATGVNAIEETADFLVACCYYSISASKERH